MNWGRGGRQGWRLYMSRASILNHEFLAPGILSLQCDIPWATSLIETTKQEEYNRDYKVIHNNNNIEWHKKSGINYHITYLDKLNPSHYDKKIL